MADYWKSKERKYCDFCKCWMGDDKMTISIHENGKRHKDNVTKRLQTIQKKSAKEHKNNLKFENELRKMEAAAMKAYMNDVEGNADITSQNINETLKQTNSQLILGGTHIEQDPLLPSTNKSEGKNKNKKIEQDPLLPSTNKSEGKNKNKKNKNKKKSGNKDIQNIREGNSLDNNLWYEAKTEDGHIYYWHIQTNESRWEPPPQGYMSIEEQEKITQKLVEKKKIEEEYYNEHKEEIEAEQKAKEQRERLKAFKAEPVTEPEVTYEHFNNAVEKVDPYGKWETVKKSPSFKMDLQLPKQEFVAIHVPILKPTEKPERVFKEKIATLDADDSSSSTGFKKRKVFGGNKKNARQRLDDD